MVDARGTLKTSALVFVLCNVTSANAQETAPFPDGLPEAPRTGLAPPQETTREIAREANVLLDRLATLTGEEEGGEARRLAAEIRERWTHSGSATMDLLLRRGRDAITEGDYARAIAHLTALTDHAPQFAEGWNQRATAFFLSDRYGEALSDIEQVLILEPRHFGALTGLAVILERLDERQAALRAFEAARAIYPADPNIEGAIDRLEQQTGERIL
ncbi:tetratricopeptide repeat protein [uncultured Jannaschia sp.]|uniref:tetratricopeptide repeat protein n=1 Tax=uncultured Jannaschia sp. TaxID=293347 RepID=UPI00262697AB|nr:tetratricopeptide repeat protein [uncultured Jannaschia sp.]